MFPGKARLLRTYFVEEKQRQKSRQQKCVSNVCDTFTRRISRCRLDDSILEVNIAFTPRIHKSNTKIHLGATRLSIVSSQLCSAVSAENGIDRM